MNRKAEVQRNRIVQFLNQELLFYADPEWQRALWSQAYGERFGQRLICYLAVWETVEDHRNDLPLPESHFEMLTELYRKLVHFQTVNDHPERPHEYLNLLNNPAWKEIQRFARSVYDRVAPSVGANS